jgi:tRNA threonylcarbamoyladenosine biosynthesis protein TsaE
MIVNLYRRANGGQFFHLDAYRLESVPEAEELDLDAMLAEGALIIEWPERLGDLIPKERMWINLDHIQEEQRQMRFNANGSRYDGLLESIRQSVFGGS